MSSKPVMTVDAFLALERGHVLDTWIQANSVIALPTLYSHRGVVYDRYVGFCSLAIGEVLYTLVHGLERVVYAPVKETDVKRHAHFQPTTSMITSALDGEPKIETGDHAVVALLAARCIPLFSMHLTRMGFVILPGLASLWDKPIPQPANNAFVINGCLALGLAEIDRHDPRCDWPMVAVCSECGAVDVLQKPRRVYGSSEDGAPTHAFEPCYRCHVTALQATHDPEA